MRTQLHLDMSKNPLRINILKPVETQRHSHPMRIDLLFVMILWGICSSLLFSACDAPVVLKDVTECIDDDTCEPGEICLSETARCEPIPREADMEQSISDTQPRPIDQAILDATILDRGVESTVDIALPAMMCDDMERNGAETDVDCGGACTPCFAGQACVTFHDCHSRVCGNGLCLPAVCGDGIRNGDESDIDCGGPCPGCAPSQACEGDMDCNSSICTDELCARPRCGDAIINGEEECDDGNTETEDCMYGLDACTVCSADCTEQLGDTDVCGDGVVDIEEQCDTGLDPTGMCAYGERACDVCNENCRLSMGRAQFCGDGVRASIQGEECDDGNAVSGDGCEIDCTVTAGTAFFRDQVQPLLVENCAECHLGQRFGFASLHRAGEDFTEEESLKNYETFLDLLSLDAPTQSRLLTKVIPSEHPTSVEHAGGALIQFDDLVYSTLLEWIELEKALRCPTCGHTAPNQYLAYVDAPNLYWALERSPTRGDRGLRDGRARIMLHPINSNTFEPEGVPIDFLDGRLCNDAGECDFGHLAVNHAGTQMVFECRIPVQEGDDWLNDVTWNICIAEIGPDGRAINPRFLMPEERRHRGRTYARSSPFGQFGLTGLPLKGVYDTHFRVRKSDDHTPIFSPDDQRIILSSRGPDPRTGRRMTRTYHGFQFADNIISVASDGSDPRSVYLNEGGTADSPFFLRNGDLAVHVWNLERMDRHLYIRTSPDGMMEQPTLFGRLQGVNMWGKATQLANGLILGMTGRRRGAVELWQPFIADHTLGTGIEEGLTSFALLDPEIDTHAPHFSYCREPPDGPNCVVDRFYLDPTYSPDGRAFVALNPELTYVAQGNAMYSAYSQGNNTEEKLESLSPFLPQSMGIWLLDHHGTRTPFISPPVGRMLRFPAWVGPRQPPRILPTSTDETVDWADLHIAHVPLWLSFRYNNAGQNKSRQFERFEAITSLRILVKMSYGNDCMNDGRAYRNAVHDTFDHPTHLGINNSTGYERLFLPAEAGGDGWGDVPLKPDGSVRVRLPAGELLLFQGVDAEGHVVTQHTRVFAMPPGHQVDTSVRREQYHSQCSSCHGAIDDQEFVGLRQTNLLPATPMDFDTDATSAEIVDLTAQPMVRQTMTFAEQIRPLLDTHCVECHVGSEPGGELSLAAQYSQTANYPAGSRVDLLSAEFLEFVPVDERVTGYDFSVPYSWYMRDGNREYREHEDYAPLVSTHAPLAELAPWDPAYQNLMVFEQETYRYLGGDGYASHYGRADEIGGNSQNAWLIEILTGDDIDPHNAFEGVDHTHLLSESEIRILRAVMDLGFPYTARCDDRVIPSGPNAGLPWGDPSVTNFTQ